jgi:hypothetical protein
MVFKNNKQTRKLSKRALLAVALLPLLLLGKSVSAEDSKRHDKWIYFDPAVSNKIEINNTYDSESDRKIPNYSLFSATFYYNYFNSNLPFTSTQGSEINTILLNVPFGSYSGLINSSKNLSDIQKLAMFSAIANSAYAFGYDKTLGDGKVLSQKDFFEKFQNILYNQNPDDPNNTIGVCRHIATNLEIMANDSGLRTAAVTGVSSSDRIGHAYNVSKLENATAVWDGGNIIIIPTMDIEKAIAIYQLSANSMTFQHQFFEDSKFKYSLTTRDGKNYLDFLGYDSSTNTIKNALFNNLPEVIPLSINLAQKQYISSGELSTFGFFVRGGEIRGDSLSPMKNTSLFQVGYNGNFTSSKLPGFSIRPGLSLVYGNIQYKNENDPTSKDFLVGASGDIVLSYNQKTGLDLSLRAGYNASFNDRSTFFSDMPLEAGVSYGFSTKNLGIEPYIISQFEILPADFGTFDYAPQFTEFKTGIAFDISPLKSTTFSLDPYYVYRNYEQELGADAKLKTKNIEFKLGGYLSQSTYDFAPDRSGINAGASVSLSDKSKVSVMYNNKVKNYSGETSSDSSFSINGTIKY